jgi:hypothetical protein
MNNLKSALGASNNIGILRLPNPAGFMLYVLCNKSESEVGRTELIPVRLRSRIQLQRTIGVGPEVGPRNNIYKYVLGF